MDKWPHQRLIKVRDIRPLEHIEDKKLNKTLSNELLQSLKEAKAIAHGEVKLSRSFNLNADITTQRFETVWDAIEDTPEEAAKLLGVTQPRISDLMRGKINLFGLDALVNMAAAAGLHIEMRISEAGLTSSIAWYSMLISKSRYPSLLR